MNTEEAGVQDTFQTTALGDEFIIEFIGSDFTGVSGYQFKIAFDSSTFEIVGNDEDYGMNGKQNILKGNGGAITGIFQAQTNPPCDTILDVAYAIIGTTDLSVSGTGLLGIISFRSKLKDGENGEIKITEGYVIGFEGKTINAATCFAGKCSCAEPVTIKKLILPKQEKTSLLSFHDNTLQFRLPDEHISKRNKVKIALYDISGKLAKTIWNGPAKNGINTIHLHDIGVKLENRIYLCRMTYGQEKKVITVTNKR